MASTSRRPSSRDTTGIRTWRKGWVLPSLPCYLSRELHLTLPRLLIPTPLRHGEISEEMVSPVGVAIKEAAASSESPAAPCHNPPLTPVRSGIRTSASTVSAATPESLGKAAAGIRVLSARATSGVRVLSAKQAPAT